MTATSEDYAKIYELISVPVSKRYDCGKYCAPLNGGEPVCCSTAHAIPIVAKSEWQLLKCRTDLWRAFDPGNDRAAQEIVNELSDDSKAIECKGAPFCERDNRTLACRAFPFFPYFTKERELVGLSYYWTFEDRCWVLSNLRIVDRQFVQELVGAYEYLFSKDEDELAAFVSQSASMRSVFSRWGRNIPVFGRDGHIWKVKPKSGGKLIAAKIDDFKALPPFTSKTAYMRAVKEERGDPQQAEFLRL